MNLSERTQNLLRFGYVSALVAWIVGFQCFLVKLTFAGRLLFYRGPDGVHFTDFVVFYNWWRIGATELKQRLYDPQVQLQFLSELLGPLQKSQLPYIQGTPFFFLLGSPLAHLSLQAAFLTWNLFTIGFFLMGYLRCLSVFSPAGARRKLFFLATAMASFPFLSCERDGQTGALLSGIVGMYCFFWLKQKQLMAGLVMSTLVIKPQYLPFLLLAPVAFRRWKVLLGFLGGVLLHSVLSWRALGSEVLLNYPSLLLSAEANSEGYLGIFTSWMVCLRGVLIYVFSEKISLLISFAICFAALTALFCLATIVRKKADLKLEAQFLSLLILSSVIFSPHTFAYDLQLLSISAALGWYCFPELQPWRKLWNSCFFAYPLIGMAYFIIMDKIQQGWLAAPFHLLPNLLLLVCSIFLIRAGIKNNNPAEAQEAI